MAGRTHTDNTERKQSGLIPFKPGQSGNPAGRPKGARAKLGEDFLNALRDDFETNGPAVIQAVRSEKPDQYLKVIASILPKEIELTADVVVMTKEQRDAAVAAAARADK